MVRVAKDGWDGILPNEKCMKWNKWIEDYSIMKRISLPRFVFEGNEGEVRWTPFHGFGDASCNSYCAPIFIEVEQRRELIPD